MDIEIFDRIEKLGAGATQEALSQYTSLILAESICTLILGVAILLIGAMGVRYGFSQYKKEGENDWAEIFGMLGLATCILGLLLCMNNLPQLIAPRAAAIQRLLQHATP